MNVSKASSDFSLLDQMTKLVGSKRYERIAYLGSGTFGTVYKAKDLNDNGRVVAIKKIKLGNRTV